MTKQNATKDLARQLQQLTGNSYQQCHQQVIAVGVDQMRQALSRLPGAPRQVQAPPVPADQWTCWRDPAHNNITITSLGWPQCRQCQAAPQYWERHQYAADARIALTIYVPAPQAPFGAMLLPGSAVVGRPAAEDRVSVYYEGWKYPSSDAGSTARQRWESGLTQAVSRLVSAYPTVACAMPRATELLAVGAFDVATDTFDITDTVALDTWLDAAG